MAVVFWQKKKNRKKAAEDEPEELSLSGNEEDVAQEIYNDNRVKSFVLGTVADHDGGHCDVVECEAEEDRRDEERQASAKEEASQKPRCEGLHRREKL